MADAPHVRPLRAFARMIAAERGAAVPDPDPLDGGVEARLLLLLETPGPSIGRTGFVSRDNPTGTAANLFRFLAEAGIARRDTLIWNAVPWVIHAPGALNRAPRRAEASAAAPYFAPLLCAFAAAHRGRPGRPLRAGSVGAALRLAAGTAGGGDTPSEPDLCLHRARRARAHPGGFGRGSRASRCDAVTVRIP